MANPTLVDLTKNIWVKVAASVTRGQVSIISNRPQQILSTYRVSGELAPDDEGEGIRVSRKSVQILSKDPIDVYLLAQGEDSKVRVDL